MRPTTVMLADDHSVLRAGLRALLDSEEDLEVVAEAGDGHACVDLASEHQPDVIVLDLTMPICGGLDAIPKLREVAPRSRILALTMHDDPSYVRRVLMTGGSGYLLKRSAGSELLTAIRAVSAGGLYVDPRHTRFLLEQAVADNEARQVRGETQRGFDRLSDREREIFVHIARGHSNVEIAEMLGISVRTVETYRARMMRKLGLDGRAAVVRLALELGVLS